MKRRALVLWTIWTALGLSQSATAYATPFSIGSLPDLQWWASARRSTLAANPDGSGPVVSGGPVGYISDLSGHGNNAVMGQSLFAGGDAFRPTYEANFQRGMPAILFDGDDDFASLGSSLVDGAGAATIAFAIQGADASLVGRRIWGASDGVNVASLNFSAQGSASVGVALQNSQTVGVTAQGGFGFTTNVVGDYSMIVVARVRPGGTTDIWENGVLRGSTSSSAAANNVIRSVQPKLLGAANSASGSTQLAPLSGSYANVRFLEGFVTTSAISDAQVADVYNYLSHEWPGVQNVRGSPNLYWNAAVNPARTAPMVDAGHLQGVALGDSSRYVFHTSVIERYDSAWQLQSSNQGALSGTPTTYGPVRHMGDGDYYNGKLYVPLEADFGSAGKYIGVYDATSPSLPLLGVRDISAQHQEVSSLVVVPEHGAQGVMYVTSFFAGVGGEQLSMYDFQGGNTDSPQFGAYLGSLTIPSSVVDIQGVEWKAPYFYFSSSGSGGNHLQRVELTDAGLAATAQIVARHLVTFQGLAIDGDSAFQAFQSGSSTEYIDELKNLDGYFFAAPGDANGDGLCDFVDLGILLNHYQLAGSLNAGDFDASGTVDFQDLGILLNNFTTSQSPMAGVTVPEPPGLMIVIVLLTCAAANCLRAFFRSYGKARLAIAWIAIVLASHSAWATPLPINLLPLGDSNTAANRGFYIAPLLSLLSSNGQVPTLLANEGHSGYIIDGSLPGAPRAGLREHIGPAASVDFLDHAHVNEVNTFILLMIGTNDVDLGFQLATDQVQMRMRGLVQAIRLEAPLAHLIVATLPPILGKESSVQKFSADLSAIDFGPRVSLVDVFSAFPADATPYFADRLHPNQAGGYLMAPVWQAGIEAVLNSVIPGDANLDGQVDFFDLGIVLNHYGEFGSYFDGDFDRSGRIDFFDFGHLLNQYGQVSVSNGSSAMLAVPEPDMLPLSIVAFIAAVGHQCSRRRQRFRAIDCRLPWKFRRAIACIATARRTADWRRHRRCA